MDGSRRYEYAKLTPCQQAILRQVCVGLKYEDIARSFGVSVCTISRLRNLRKGRQFIEEGMRQTNEAVASLVATVIGLRRYGDFLGQYMR